MASPHPANRLAAEWSDGYICRSIPKIFDNVLQPGILFHALPRLQPPPPTGQRARECEARCGVLRGNTAAEVVKRRVKVGWRVYSAGEKVLGVMFEAVCGQGGVKRPIRGWTRRDEWASGSDGWGGKWRGCTGEGDW